MSSAFDFSDLDSIERRFLRRLRRQTPRLDLGVIDGVPLSPTLDELYVPLEVFDGAPDGEALEVEELRALALYEQGGPGAADALVRADVAKLNRWAARAGSRRSLEEVLSQTPCCVLLGDPGSGKSLAMQRLQHDLSEAGSARVPVLVRLATCDELIAPSSPDAGLFDLVEQVYKRQHQPGIGRLAEARFEEGRLTLLLDGLDEVLHRETRGWLATRIRELFDDAAENGSRVIVTSRCIGYREAPVVGAPEYTIAPLKTDNIKQFIIKLSIFLIIKVGNPKQSASAWADTLIAEVNARVELKDLAAVPLHLVHLSLLRWEVEELPQSRVLLYDRMLDRLLRDWIQTRSQGARRAPPPSSSDPQRMKDGLKALAFTLHQRWPSGTAPEHDVLEILSGALRTAGVPRPDQEARSLLDEARRRAGVLVERAQRRFGFLHLSLEDFLAGQALAELGAVGALHFLCEHDRMHDPRWQEPLRLAVAWLGQRPEGSRVARDLIQEIAWANGQARTGSSPHEGLFHRDLLLAAELASEQGTWPELRAELVERGEGANDPEDPADRRLVDLLTCEVPPLRWEAARRLGLLARAGCERAAGRLCAWMETTGDISTAEALIPHLRAPGLARVREVIRTRLDTTLDWRMARLLVGQAPVDEEDLRRVVAWARQPRGEFAHSSLLWPSLARLVRDSAPVREAVLDELRRPDGDLPMPPSPALKDDPELCLLLLHRWASRGLHGADDVATALGDALAAQGVPARDVLNPIREHWNTSAHVVPALRAYADDPHVRDFLWSVVDAQATSPVGHALVVLAKGADDSDVARMVSGLKAAAPGGQLGWVMGLTRVARTPAVAAALDGVLQGADDSAKQDVVRAQGATASDEALIGCLRDDQRPVRDAAIPELARRAARPGVARALRDLLHEDPRHRAARSWAWAPLSLLYEHDERVRERFAEGVAAGDEEACRWLACVQEAPTEIRIKAVAQLRYGLHGTLWQGGQELIDRVAEAELGLDVLKRLCAGFEVRTGLLRGALARALLPRTGLRALMDAAGDAALHVLGDVYDALPPGQQPSLNKIWETAELWYRWAPPVQTPTVQEQILCGVLDRDHLMLRWAPLLGAEMHEVEGITDAVRAACEDPDDQNRAQALRVLCTQDALTEPDRAVLLRCATDPSSLVQREALDQLLIHAPQDGLEIFRALRKHEAAPLRHRAILGLVAAGDLVGSDALPWLGIHSDASLLYGGEPLDGAHMRWAVAEAVAAQVQQEPSLREQAEALMDDPRWPVRQGAAFVLLHLGWTPALVDRLLQGLDDHRTEEVSVAQADCARALLPHARPEVRDEALTALARGLSAGLDPTRDARLFEVVRQHCARVLNHADLLIRTPEIEHALRGALDDPSQHVRGEAWRALRRVLTAPAELHLR